MKTAGKNIDINLQAMGKMSEICDVLERSGYQGRDLETYLVRLLFCFFADDTGIFCKGQLYDYILHTNHSDGVLTDTIMKLFAVLDRRKDDREGFSEELAEFPYINGRMFAGELPVHPLADSVRNLLLSSQEIAWGRLSPAIFGAMFQEIMNQKTRREWGTYYTSEENIRKLIRPLFLDNLWAEFHSIKHSRHKLLAFHEKLTELRFLDPACGCGNFLIVTYQELRRLELEVIRNLYDMNQRVLDVGMYCRVQVSQFYGIEYEPFQAHIAKVCMWLADHQLNMEAADAFGMYYARIPLVQSASIVEGNALSMDWNEVVAAGQLNYIIGNPPFVGARLMNEGQKQDIRNVFRGSSAAGNMDYVTAWYRKAASYMAETQIRAAFVSTNSICQGEQAAMLWKSLKFNYHTGIDFAYRSFVWNNEARGQAKVHCVIIGFSDWSVRDADSEKKSLFDGDEEWKVSHINGYLIAAPDVYVQPRRSPVSEWVPAMTFGSMANDGGDLILQPEEADFLMMKYPQLKEEGAIRPFIGSEEYINRKQRYCLWLLGIRPEVYENIPEIQRRIQAVKSFREYSPRAATRKLAKFPEIFGEIRQPEQGKYILVPRVSSWRRSYIPMGFLPAETIASDAAQMVPQATEELFGILTSAMHMAWVRAVAGRLKSDYRYSSSIVYNNFPFPDLDRESADDIHEKAARVLAIREQYAEVPLAWLYDDTSMPSALKNAHRELDLAVDRSYGYEFDTEKERVIFLMDLYSKL